MQCVKEPEKPLYGGGIVTGASAGGKKLAAPIKGSVLKVDLKKDQHYALSGNHQTTPLHQLFFTISSADLHVITATMRC